MATQQPPAANLAQALQMLDALDSGIALLDGHLHVAWANPAFRQWCPGDPLGQELLEALARPEVVSQGPAPWSRVQAGQTMGLQLRLPTGPYLDLRLTPLPQPDGQPAQILVRARNVSEAVTQRQKLEALHQAGRELAALHVDQLADMSPEERVELLKLNLRRIVHDLLHYDVIEIRLLNRQSGLLEPLLEEGMTPDAARRVLRAGETGNGVTGLVAATGRSYLCPDTARDPHYLPGAEGAHSSLTVPLVIEDMVIGTLNVENPRLNAFTPEDQQFAELFSREVAQALHTLDLLSAQKLCSSAQSIDAINRVVAVPVDEVLAAATGLLARQGDGDPETVEALKRIVEAARSVKTAIQKVGDEMAPPTAGPGAPPSRLRGLRVLMVDGDERIRRSAHAMLDRFGCLVETARTGREAIDLAGTTPYDVVLTDIRLADMTGYEAYQRLKQIRPSARVVLMTAYGYDSTHSIVKARQEGLRFVIYKPLRPDQVLDALLSPDKPALVPPRADSQPEVIQAS